MTDVQAAAASAQRPRWRLLVIAAAIIVLILVIVIVAKVAGTSPVVPLGVTDSDDLVLGSCLHEDDADLDEYTVVDCSVPHPQQVIATIDLSKSDNVYTQFEAMSSYAQEVCDRLIEYRLFVREEPSYDDFEFALLAMPSEKQFEHGDTDALCTIVRTDGDDVTENYYRPMP